MKELDGHTDSEPAGRYTLIHITSQLILNHPSLCSFIPAVIGKHLEILNRRRTMSCFDVMGTLAAAWRVQ